ncbi:MAG: helix-turn-helix domain-containing protein [Candidatus Gracilibacteria bacterium]
MDAIILKKLGMSKKEIALYLKLLEYGESGVSNLSRSLGENRTSTYSLLTSMKEKGIVSFYVKNNLKIFVPSDPTILINHFMDGANSLKRLLPELLAIHNKYGKTKPKITFYEGVDGIKQIGELLLEVPGSTRLSFMGIDKNIHPEIKKYYEEDFINRRIEAKIKYRGIVTGKLPIGNKYESTEEGQLRILKYIDPKKFPMSIHIDIFPNNKVALYSYHKDDLMGVVIEHEHFYNTMKTVFELAWAGVEVLR